MGYKILYSSQLNKKYSVYKPKFFGKKFLIVTILCAIMFLSPVRQWIAKTMLPYNLNKASDSFSDMICHIENGQPISDAITAFCQDIINDP